MLEIEDIPDIGKAAAVPHELLERCPEARLAAGPARINPQDSYAGLGDGIEQLGPATRQGQIGKFCPHLKAMGFDFHRSGPQQNCASR